MTRMSFEAEALPRFWSKYVLYAPFGLAYHTDGTGGTKHVVESLPSL